MDSTKTAKYIPSLSVNAFALQFRGNPSGHYVLTEHKRYHHVKEGASTMDYLRHLRGDNPSLLISPILAGGKCFLAGLDMDRHGENDSPVDCAALAKQVTSLRLPLIVTRSKNGRGAWLWLFFKEADGFDAAAAVRLMGLYRDVLELPKDTEIFPKQADVAEDKSGSGLNLPLFGDQREAYGVNGEVLDLDGFLRLATERASYGVILAHRDLDITVLDHQVSGGPAAVEIEAGKETALPGAALRTLYQQFLEKLAHAAKGTWTLSLNGTAYFCGRCFAAQVLDATETDIKTEIRKAARTARSAHQHSDSELENILEKAWKDGTARPFKILDPEQEHAIAFRQIDQLLHDESLEVTVPKAVMFSAAKLDDLEYATLRRALAKRLNMSADDLDKHVDECRPKQEEGANDSMAGSALMLADVQPWHESVQLAPLLDELSQLFRDYIVFQNNHDSYMLGLWVVVTYCVEHFNIAPLVGVTAISRECGKTSLLRILLHLVRKGKGTISLTLATAFRIVDKYHPTLIADEVDKWLQNNPELLTIFLAGHEREFSKVFRCVGEDAEEREFDCFGPKCWAQIGLPDDQLVSRSLVVSLLTKKPSEKVKSWPKVGMPAELNDVFIRLQRQCIRWVNDNVDAIRTSQPEVASLDNRLQDNWYPLLVVATLGSDEWKRRALTAAGVDAVIAEAGEQITLLRDVRNIFHTHGIDRIPSWLLLADLLLQVESPWAHYERQPDGLSAQQLGQKLRAMGIPSKPMRFEKQYLLFDKEKNLLKGYQLAWFSNLFERQLAGEQPEDAPIHELKQPM
jgi:hypothetical protein